MIICERPAQPDEHFQDVGPFVVCHCCLSQFVYSLFVICCQSLFVVCRCLWFVVVCRLLIFVHDNGKCLYLVVRGQQRVVLVGTWWYWVSRGWYWICWFLLSFCVRFPPCRQFQICVNCSPSSTMFHAVVTSWVCFHSPVLQSNSRVQQRFDLVVAEDQREVSSSFRGEIEECIAYG